jgi:hypothetical protein
MRRRLAAATLARAGLVAASTLAAFALAGCGMQRALAVESSPPGARLWVNGAEHGVTPQRIAYVHDGLFTLRLEKDGYESIADEVRTKTEIDAVPGVDFFAENFGPHRERVTSRHYDLVPLRSSPPTEAELKAAIERARAFRTRTAAEIAEPGTPTPTRSHTAAPAPAAVPAAPARPADAPSTGR